MTPLLALLCLGIFSTTFSTGAFPAILPELARGGALADWQVGLVASAFGFARMAADIHLRRRHPKRDEYDASGRTDSIETKL